MLQKLFVAAIIVLSFTSAHSQIASVVYTSHVDSAAKAAEEVKKEPSLIITGSLDAY